MVLNIHNWANLMPLIQGKTSYLQYTTQEKYRFDQAENDLQSTLPKIPALFHVSDLPPPNTTWSETSKSPAIKSNSRVIARSFVRLRWWLYAFITWAIFILINGWRWWNYLGSARPVVASSAWMKWRGRVVPAGSWRGEAVEEAKPTSVLAGCGSSGVRHDGALKFMVFNGDANWKLVN